MTTTAAQIRRAMCALDLNQVADHFSLQRVGEVEVEDPENATVGAEDIDREDVEDTNAVEPFQVCDGVSVDAFNKYVGDGEGLRIGVRFLELTDDGRLLVIDLSSALHESTVGNFRRAFMLPSGKIREIRAGGSTTAHRSGQPHKEADATFGPRRVTPHRTQPPQGIPVGSWFTLAVEVGCWQSWPSLENAARWWYDYPGVQYVLLISISPRRWWLSYRVYDVVHQPIGPQDALPPVPAQYGSIRGNGDGAPENVSFDARRILSIPPGMPLPPGMDDPITVDLRHVREMVIGDLGPPY